MGSTSLTAIAVGAILFGMLLVLIWNKRSDRLPYTWYASCSPMLSHDVSRTVGGCQSRSRPIYREAMKHKFAIENDCSWRLLHLMPADQISPSFVISFRINTPISSCDLRWVIDNWGRKECQASRFSESGCSAIHTKSTPPANF